MSYMCANRVGIICSGHHELVNQQKSLNDLIVTASSMTTKSHDQYFFPIVQKLSLTNEIAIYQRRTDIFHRPILVYSIFANKTQFIFT